MRMDIENYMNIVDTNIQKAFKWAIEYLIPEVMNNDNFEVPAKGGTEINFSNKYDMNYRIHFITGLTSAIRVIDYSIKKNNNMDIFKKQDDLTYKRAFFAYLFHDYNKIKEDRYMKNCVDSIEQIINSSQNLKNIMHDLSLNIEDLCFTAKATEIKTMKLLFTESSFAQKSLAFESDFCTLADTISSIYANGREIGDLKFGNIILIKNEDIKKIKIQSTNLFALSGLARHSVKVSLEKIKNGEATFLWDTSDTLLYVGSDLTEDDFNEIKKTFKDSIRKKILENQDQTITMDDRRLEIPSAYIYKLDPANFEEYLNNDNIFIKNVLYLNNKDLNNKDMECLQEYIEEVKNLNFTCFNIVIPKTKKLRNVIEINNDADFECKLNTLMTRFIQIKGNDILKNINNASETKKMIDLIKEKYNVYKNRYTIFDLDNKQKSALLIPLLISSNKINFKKLIQEVFEYLESKKNFEESDFNNIFDSIIFSKLNSIEEVPDKTDISIISGTRGFTVAEKYNLFGVNHQTFTNRVMISKNIAAGKIDKISFLENIVRKCILPISDSKKDSTILFSRLPGPLPIFNIYAVLRDLNSIDWIKKNENGFPENITIGDLNISPQVDNSILVVLGNMNSDETSLEIFDKVLGYAKKTGFQCLITYSNSPVIEGQIEIIRFEVNNSLLSGMGYTLLRYSQLDQISKEFNLLKNITKNSYGNKKLFKNMANILRDYINEPLSIFQYIKDFNKMFYQNSGEENFQYLLELLKKRGVKMYNMDVLADKAVEIKRVSSKDSTNEKTWLIREPIEALEKLQAESRRPDGTKRPLADFREYIEGIILSSLERDETQKKYINIEKIEKFSDALVTLLNEDFSGKIPSGSLKSYLISAFEFLYVKKSQEAYLKGGLKNEL